MEMLYITFHINILDVEIRTTVGRDMYLKIHILGMARQLLELTRSSYARLETYCTSDMSSFHI